MMQQQILDYLKTQRIGVLALEMLDGSPHAATVHFAHSENPVVFYFETNKKYRKAEALFGREVTRASLVIGSDENNMATLQMDGVAALIKPDEQKVFEDIYLGKFPAKHAKINDEAVFFRFIPTWWRFTDWRGSTGKVILTS